MARWPEKKNETLKPDVSVESVELVEPAIEQPLPSVVIVKVGNTVGDVVVTEIIGKGEVTYVSGRLHLPDGVTVWIQHKDIGKDATLCLSSGSPQVVNLDKAAFKAGIYKLL